MKRFLCCTLLAGWMAAQAACAQDAPSPLPPATTVGNVTYLSGGIGIDESTAMKQAASRYPLELVFGAKVGASEEYTADVKVRIRDRAGKEVLDTVSKGPYLLADLPDGSYQVQASSDGVAKTERVVLKKGSHRRLVFSWP